MESRQVTIAAALAMSVALGLAACSTGTDSDADFQDTSAAVAEQSSGGSSGSSRTAASGSEAGNPNEGDASALENSDTDASSSSPNEGDAGSLEEHFANEQNEGDASALEEHNAESAEDPSQEAESAVDSQGPKIVLANKRCNSGKLLTQWNIKDASGVNTAVVYRYNEFNTPITSEAEWMGPETGDGNNWAATSNGSQNLKSNVRIVATDKNGNTNETTIQAPSGC